MRTATPDFPAGFWWRVLKAGCWLVIVTFGGLAAVGALRKFGYLHWPT